MSNQVVTVIVEDAAIVDKLQASRTEVDEIVVGNPTATIIVPVGWSASDTITTGDGDYDIENAVVDGNTIVEDVVIGTPIRIGDTQIFTPGGGIDSSAIFALIDSDYINARVDGVDSAAVFALIDSDYINDRVDLGVGGQLVWETQGVDSEFRVNIGFVEDGINYTVRTASFNADNLLQLELAQFTPTVDATGQSLNWDDSATTWSVSVTNPDDITNQFLDSVESPLLSATGMTTDVTLYTTTGPDSTGPGVDWTETFTTNLNASILSSGTGLTGGTAGATVQFNDNNDVVWTETASLSFNWSNANVTLNFNSLSGNTFLQSYTSVGYNLNITGISNIGANTSSLITPVGGTISNTSDDGTMTFTTPIHKDNNDNSRSVSVATDFTRPPGVTTGGSYVVQDTASDTTISTTFTYPSFWLFTVGTATVPDRPTIIDGTSYDAAVVNTLGNQVKNFSAFVDNTDVNPRAFWFGVRASATQPTSFQTGSGPGLVSDVSFVTNSVDLEPDTPPGGYSAETFSLYGFVLQPGQTYVVIS